MKKIMNCFVVLLAAVFLSACGPHYHVVKAKPVIIKPHTKYVVLVKPVKVKHYRKGYY